MWTLALRDGRGTVTYRGRPVSGEAVRRFYAEVSTDEGGAVFRLMRLAFPLSWRRLWWRDIARRVSLHPDRAMLVQGYIAWQPPVLRVPDSWDLLDAAQRVEERRDAVPYAVICRLVEVRLGAGWWHDPVRWPTADGFAPHDEVMTMWRELHRVQAWERLSLVRAILATKAERGQAMIESDEREVRGG